MKTIYKYDVPFEDHPIVQMPDGAVILAFQLQMGSGLVVWAIVDTEAPIQLRQLELCGTGHPLGEVGTYIGTVQQGRFVWHLFEAKL